MDVNERIELIKRNTQEIIGEDELRKLLEEKKNPVIYWGTAPTGRPHVGYFLPMLKVADLLKAGFKVKILLADLHAALDNTPWVVLEKRYDYYAAIFPLVLESIGVDTKNLEFVKGSDFQLKAEYMFDVLRMSTSTSVRDSTKAASEVVKMGKSPNVAGMIYPLMQAIDEQYLDSDAQLGGVDQRKIMVLARENLPKLGYKPRIEVMNPMLPGLIGDKMSASDEKSKIDLLDSPESVKKKLKGAKCIEGDCDNGLMNFLKYVIMTLKSDKGEKLVIERPDKYGGNLEYSNYEELEKDFKAKKLHPLDLKNAVAEEISKILSVVQKKKKELEKISEKAYGK